MNGSGETKTQRTEHAMLVAWGYFSRWHYLAERLRQRVTIPRHHENIPAGDLILEFGLLLLAGSTQLQDLNLGPRPLVKDEAVREAWQITRWGHYTAVSRALKAATAETVHQVVAVLDEVSRPFIEYEVASLVAQEHGLVLYADLSGRPVSAYSASYPEVRWGHMGQTLALGHQHALITLHGQEYRLHLAGFLHPGDTVSETCLRELIQAAEQRLSCRPRRRVELVQERLEVLARQLARYRAQLSQQEQAQQQEQERQRCLQQRLTAQDPLLVQLESQEGDKPVRPYSRLAKARKQQASWRRQLQQSQRREGVIRGQLDRQCARLGQLLHQQAELGLWHGRLLFDNATNANPVAIRIHIDGGFSGGDNLTYLIELGYAVLAVGKGPSTTALRQELPATAQWVPVTAQVRLWAGPPATVGSCPYPLRRILQHWQARDKQRDSTFLQYPADDPMTVADVFSTYHQRQHAEAGIKQGKSVFGSRDVRIRSAAGLELLNQFAFVFWPNFVHWATAWLRPKVRQSSKPFEAVLRTVKTQVQVAAQTPATVVTAPGSRVLAFCEEGPYPNVRLKLDGIYAFQLPLPLFRCEPAEHMIRESTDRLLSPPVTETEK